MAAGRSTARLTLALHFPVFDICSRAMHHISMPYLPVTSRSAQNPLCLAQVFLPNTGNRGDIQKTRLSRISWGSLEGQNPTAASSRSDSLRCVSSIQTPPPPPLSPTSPPLVPRAWLASLGVPVGCAVLQRAGVCVWEREGGEWMADSGSMRSTMMV